MLTYHVVPGQLSPENLAGTHETLEGDTLEVTGSGEDFTVNGDAAVVCGNVQTANATVYLIDGVLLPAAGLIHRSGQGHEGREHPPCSRPSPCPWSGLAQVAARRLPRMAEPMVGMIMGSRSDWETMHHAAETLEALGVPYETRVVSAHRTPDLLFEYALHRRRARPPGDHRRRRRRRAPPRHGRREDPPAGARRAGGVQGAQRHGLAAVDRADAGRHAGRHAGDRPRGRRQRGAAGRSDPGARRRGRQRSGCGATARSRPERARAPRPAA